MATKETGWSCTHEISIVESTHTAMKVQVTCYWQNNGWSYNINHVSAWVYCGSSSIQVKSDGSVVANSSNSQKVLCGSATFTISRAKANRTLSCYAKITSNSSYVSGTKTSTKSNVVVSAKPSYTVSYNANGGSGAPSSQTKWYGENITLSSAKPTRSGYGFLKWNTKSDGSGTSYTSGETYSTDKSLDLHAIWSSNTYTVSYDANGGTGAPTDQTKQYGVDLTLSSVVPTKTNYTFKGWGASASSTTVSYTPGSSYSQNASTILYAIWELGYKPPRINKCEVFRANVTHGSDGGNIIEPSDTGVNIAIDIDIQCDALLQSIKYGYKAVTDTTWTYRAWSYSSNGIYNLTKTLSDSVVKFNIDTSYDIEIEVTDAKGNYIVYTTLPSVEYFIDIMRYPGKKSPNSNRIGDTGIAFGKVAELNDVCDIGYKTKFTGGIQNEYLISNGSVGCDLNLIKTPNVYYSNNSSSVTYNNKPPGLTGGFTLEVMSAGQSDQIMQRITKCSKTDPKVYIRHYFESGWGSWILLQESKDTGWLNITLSSGITVGHTPEFRARVKNGILYIEGSVKGVSSDWICVATLPTGITDLITIDKEKRFSVLYDLRHSFGALLKTNGQIHITMCPTGSWDSTLSIHFSHSFAIEYK